MSSSYRPGRRVSRVVAVAAAALSAAGALGTVSVAGAAAHKSHGAAAHKSSVPSVRNAANLSKEPVVHGGGAHPPTKLVTKDLVPGTGSTVTSTSSVEVKYVGANYVNGKDFTVATWTSGQPTTFALATVVPGFAQGLVGMKVGGRREIVIPPALAYGPSGAGPVKGNETLVFVVDLKAVTP